MHQDKKILYTGPYEGNYTSDGFFETMDSVVDAYEKGDSFNPIVNEAIINPRNQVIPQQLRNIWHVNGVMVMYTAEYEPTSLRNVKPVSAEVVLHGETDRLGEVEKKILAMMDKVVEFPHPSLEI